MRIKNETAWYTALSIICLIFIITLNIFSPTGSFKHNMTSPVNKPSQNINSGIRRLKQLPLKEITNTANNRISQSEKGSSGRTKLNTKTLSKEYKITPHNMMIIGYLSIVYIILFIFGLINLFIFIVKAARKEQLLTVDALPRTLSLSNKNVSMIIFGTLYLYLAMYLISFALMPKGEMGPDYFLTIFIVMSIVFYSFIIISVLKVVPFNSLGGKLSAKNIISSIRVYFAALIVIIITVLILFQIQKIFHLSFKGQQIVYIVSALKERWLLRVLIAEIIVLAPISEELLFRGIMYNYLRRRFPWGNAAVLTSLLFAFLHANLFGFFIIFIISIAICYLYEKTNNITVAFFFHGFHNTLNIVNILILKHLFIN